jgi:NADH-quinone oxidoreductase subunit G
LRAALNAADSVVAVSAFAGPALREQASVLLPLAPMAESEGSFMNLEGRSFTVRPAGKPAGSARPGWKILRRLGSECGVEGFEQINLAQVFAEMPTEAKAASSAPVTLSPVAKSEGLQRIGEVPMYSVDAICRRSESLQKTVHAPQGQVTLNPADAQALGLSDGARAVVSQDGGNATLTVAVSNTVPEGAVLLPAANSASAQLGAAWGPIKVAAAGSEA